MAEKLEGNVSETALSHGGIETYDAYTGRITFGDRSYISLQDLAQANRITVTALEERILDVLPANQIISGKYPGSVSEKELRELRGELSTAVGNPILSKKEMTDFLAKMARVRTVAERTGSVIGDLSKATYPSPVGPKPITSTEALKVILEEIKAANDPFKAAGKWLTKFTNGVTEITRGMELEE